MIMGRTYLGNSYKIKMYLGSTPIHRMYLGNERIYPNAGMVTYHVDTNVTYTEEVDIDESILNPTTFTPSKSGWTFVGWRKDTVANGSVLSNEVMTGDDVTLYAVFRQTITLSYNGNGNTGGSTASQSGTRYYNNGNVANPSFVLRTNGFTRTSYGFQNWAMGSTSGTRYSSGASVTLATSTTFFAMWKLTSIPTSAANSLNIGDPYWQADRKDERKTIGPYDMTGVNTLTFDLSVKAAHGTTTNVWVGLSSNGIDFARSTSYSLSDAGEVGGSNTYDDPLLSVNVSGLSGNYYIMHRVQISSYCYSYCNSIAVS